MNGRSEIRQRLLMLVKYIIAEKYMISLMRGDMKGASL